MSKVAERRQNLRDALLRAAEETIARDGLAALRARDLANEVGCALGAIYNVFPDLDALILAVNARTLAAFERFLGEAGAKDRSDPDDPDAVVTRLVTLALAYLDFARTYGHRWRALFEHRMSGGREIPASYRDAQRPLFSLVEEPLKALRRDLDDGERALLGRSLFSAVHGVVQLGLDEKLATLPPAILKAQVREVVTALGLGLVQEQETGSAHSRSNARGRASSAPSSDRRKVRR